MKIKTLGWIILIFLLISNIWAILMEVKWLENSTYLFYFIAALLVVGDKYKKFSKNLYLFTSFSVLAFFVITVSRLPYTNEFAMVLLSFANVALIIEAARFIEIKSASTYMLLYFTAIVGINGGLLGFHLMEIKEYLTNPMVFSVYVLYYFNLLVLGIISFVYYLNSYSKKSMYFISLALGLLFANVLSDMGVFLLKDLGVEVVESVIRMGCAIFAVLFFVTTEKQLRLINML